METISQERINELLNRVRADKLHQHLGIEILEAANGEAKAQLHTAKNNLNFAGDVHGGNWYVLLDVIAYCASITTFAPGENAVSIDMHCSMMRAVGPDTTVDFVGKVTKRGRSLDVPFVFFGQSRCRQAATLQVDTLVVRQLAGIANQTVDLITPDLDDLEFDPAIIQ